MNEASQMNSTFPPKCDVSLAFLHALGEALKHSSLSRPLIIDRMNDALGGEQVVTADRFSKWCAPGTDRHMPIQYLPALCWALRTTSIVDVLLSPIEFRAVDKRGQTLQEIAALNMQAEQLKEKASQLQSSLLPITTNQE
ncbi:hypothetical protein MHM93_15410 [Pseudoalteromonas sp. MM17-2]|uniref:hypothetical protein n=1 Tax=Pseudoalteromonas sp. MM17-2 TaxID=2917753 RepID=UPI001EF6AECF|nr:hypothetical protein [Pseudoalteromonas sp. MM17-2]MCG7545569.1 hypothetical protein [Pseudoalteromonas sp. MM17-2]